MGIIKPAAASNGVAVPGQKRRKQPPGAGSFNNIRLTRDKPPKMGADSLSPTGEKALCLVPRTRADNGKALERRAKSKYLTQTLAVKLANVADTSQSKGYWRTYHCSSVMQKQGDRMVARFCKCRWCLTCCNIRTAELLKDYLPILKSWPEKYLVTLTIPNVQAEDLEDAIQQMLGVMSKIRETLKKQHQRGQRAAQLVGFRKLEVTYSPARGDYHPHFHLLLNNRQAGDDLRNMWMAHFPAAKWDGQNVKQADNNSAAEVMKYFTKIISRHSAKRVILVEQLNVIFEAVAGVRTFQTLGGIKVTKSTDADKQEADALAEAMETEAVYEWQQVANDWVNLDTGELLTGFEPSEQMRELVEKRMIYTSTTLPPSQKGP